MKYPTYDIGEHVYAWSDWLDVYGGYISIHGKIIEDKGFSKITIELDKDSAFARNKKIEVRKDKIFA